MPNYQTDDLRGTIIFGNGTSKNYGCIIEEVPSLGAPARKSTSFSIPGRNGVILMQDDAFEDVPKSYKVAINIDNNDELTEVSRAFCRWLYQKGYQRLEDSFEPDVYRLAYFNGPVDIENLLMMYGKATINFVCRAERFLKSGETFIDVEDGDTLHNSTGFDSKPLIHLEGTGACSISIGSQTMNVALTDYINIDCDRMNAYRQEGENANTLVSGEFPLIKSGANSITLTGNISKASIRPNYYTL